MEHSELVSLIQTSTLLAGVVVSCVDRKRFPFTKTQMNIFTVLDMEGDLSMKRIAQLLGTSQEQATRTVAPLANAGYVERRTDPTNRTRVLIHLTDSGKQIIEESRQVLIENLATKLDKSLNIEEKQSLCEAACVMAKILDKIN
ncbi:MAG: MarR family transcriptional regulator [Pseudobutyrivibrio sp.]|nr:MarR family transcriptional regulator [Pseudobutyrivibrio sp.]